ncbi:MAG: aromatic amino acid lyase [Burkholderiales bacterium]|nr:aromatic amino acid lyase [Burkholderiales bacterium]
MTQNVVTPPYLIDATPITCDELAALARSERRFAFSLAALQRLQTDREVVQRYIDSGEPVYGLNTGLGGNLAYRLEASEVEAFQAQVIVGRMIGMGPPLPLDVVHLGLSAHLAAPVIGQGEAFFQGHRYQGAAALQAAGLMPVRLQAKDGLALINASPVTAGYAALVASDLAELLLVAAAVAALADEGYAANLSVFDPRIAAARPAGAQVAATALFRALLAGSSLYAAPPRSIQDALSFRTMAQLFGSTHAALAMLSDAVESEINGISDSPLVLAAEGEMLSSPNFHPPMIALTFDSMAIALTHLATASVQRVIKLQNPALSGLPKYLSPVGGASVGFNAMQKTAAALHAEIRLKATPASLDAVVVSDTVEDHATHALFCVRKLDEQMRLVRHLVAVEALVAAQAIDLRGPLTLGVGTQVVFDAVRSAVAPLQADRPCGPDAMAAQDGLFAASVVGQLRAVVGVAMAGHPLRGV